MTPPSNELKQILGEIESRKGVAARFAAGQMDWTQVALNGGPPCFHICDDLHFCGRAERWDGHGEPGFHDFVSLADLIASARTDVPALVKALRRATQYISVSGIPETRKKVLSDITAILNQGREDKKELGEKDAS